MKEHMLSPETAKQTVNHMLSSEVARHIRRKQFDIPYSGGSQSQKLDIWYPNEEKEGPYPVILFFHGGGFMHGGKGEDSSEPVLRGTDRGYVVVDCEYRKSRESRFPAMVYDAKAAIRFLKANARRYQLDPDRIALWGPSSGGWLVSITALTEGNPAFEDLSMGNGGYDCRVAAVIDWCGPCGGFLAMDEAFEHTKKGVPDHNLPDSPESVFLGSPLPEIPELVRLANPCTYAHQAIPPFLIVHGTGDAVVPYEQSETFFRTLQQAAGPDKAELYTGDGAPHHGRNWWHEPWLSDLCFDFLDRNMG